VRDTLALDPLRSFATTSRLRAATKPLAVGVAVDVMRFEPIYAA
jgi:hypothetical protein